MHFPGPGGDHQDGLAGLRQPDGGQQGGLRGQRAGDTEPALLTAGDDPDAAAASVEAIHAAHLPGAAFLDLEAGMKSVQDWRGASIPVRSFTDFRDLAVLIGGPDPAQHPQSWYGAEYHAWLQQQYLGTGIEDFLARKPDHPYIVVNDMPKVEALKSLFPTQYASRPVLVASR